MVIGTDGSKKLLRFGGRVLRDDLLEAALAVLFTAARDGRLLNADQLVISELLQEVVSHTTLASLLNMKPKKAAAVLLLQVSLSSSKRLRVIKYAALLAIDLYENRKSRDEKANKSKL